MTFDWSAYLLVAERLRDQEVSDRQEQEALWRTAIGRSYFAAFGTARAHLSDFLNDARIPEQGAHAYVRNRLKGLRRERSEYGAAATYLHRLDRRRRTADYDGVWEGDLAAITHDAVEDSKRVLRCLAAVQP